MISDTQGAGLYALIVSLVLYQLVKTMLSDKVK